MIKEKEIKEQFRPLLPFGFVSIIQSTLKGKYHRSLSRGKISQVCNPEHSDWDADVITIALDLAAETKRKNDAISSKADSL